MDQNTKKFRTCCLGVFILVILSIGVFGYVTYRQVSGGLKIGLPGIERATGIRFPAGARVLGSYYRANTVLAKVEIPKSEMMTFTASNATASYSLRSDDPRAASEKEAVFRQMAVADPPSWWTPALLTEWVYTGPEPGKRTPPTALLIDTAGEDKAVVYLFRTS